LKKHEDEIKEKYNVTKIGVFGSFARGEGKKGSDGNRSKDVKERY